MKQKISLIFAILITLFYLCAPVVAMTTSKATPIQQNLENIIEDNIYYSEKEILADSSIVESTLDVVETTTSTATTTTTIPPTTTTHATAAVQTKYPFNEAEIKALAKLVWGEARGVTEVSHQAAVIWCVLNRVDATQGSTIMEIITAKNQFSGYSPSYPVTDEFKVLAKDVLTRWYNEKNGQGDVGRVLPKDYLWFSEDKETGLDNVFRNSYYYSKASYWDWSLPDPYSQESCNYN